MRCSIRIGVPRQVVVHHRVAELEVAAFSAGLGRNEDPWTGMVAERRNGGIFLFRPELAMKDMDWPCRAKSAGEIRLGITELREDEDFCFLVRVTKPGQTVEERLRP